MRTFAELLTEYTSRVGISDSELARALGVRRQTIFRWKEGLVEKPRYRDDVLRCAVKLRLTTEESDELLLAAGFPPETSSTGASAASSPTSEATGSRGIAASSESSAAYDPDPAWRKPEVRRFPSLSSRTALGTSLLVLLLVGAVGLTLWQGDTRTYPTAAPGERLIVVGSLGGQANGGLQPNGPDARLKAAVEREAQASRLERVRVEMWPQGIRDESDAAAVRGRSGAEVVIGGITESGSISAFMHPVAAPRADDLELAALVSAPPSLGAKVSTSSEELQALSLLALSRLQLQQGNRGAARAAINRALANPPADASTVASLYFYLGYVDQTVQPPELDGAIEAYSKAIELSQTAEALLNRGLAYVRQARRAEWEGDLSRAQALRPDDPSVQLALCWANALDGQPDAALPNCDGAVKASADGYSREARGVAYAELGRLSEAATEIGEFTGWLGRQPESLRARFGTAPEEWTQALKAGKNPFDHTTLEELRHR